MKQRAQIEIFGKVQGVTFRYSSKQMAKKLGLFGCVENRNDGSVYMEVEGERDSLEEFITWCKHGPERARVKNVIVSFNDQLKDYKNFQSVHTKGTQKLLRFFRKNICKIATLQKHP